MGDNLNLVRQYPWHIVCLVSLLFIVVQIVSAKRIIGHKTYPNTYVCCIVYMFIKYMIITGQSTM